MLKNLIKTCADATGMTQVKAREALGIVLNTAERQGSPLAEAIFRKMPGARTLSATTGAAHGAAPSVIARLIEQTPGGRRHVGDQQIHADHLWYGSFRTSRRSCCCRYADWCTGDRCRRLNSFSNTRFLKRACGVFAP